MEMAKTIPLKRLAFELYEISTLLQHNFQELINLENTYDITLDQQIEKAKLIDTIAKLILKL